MSLDVNGTVVDRFIFSCHFFYLPLVVQPQLGPRYYSQDNKGILHHLVLIL